MCPKRTRKKLTHALLIMLTLNGCSPALNASDRALLSEAQSAAEKAKEDAQSAANDATEARKAAEAAAAQAAAANTRADRIFQASQNK